jgi:hypothetical protein
MPGRRRLPEAGCILLCTVLASRASAAADAKIPVHVEMGACDAAPRDDVMPLVRVELGAQLVDAPPDVGCNVTVECSDDVVTVSVAARDRLRRSHRTDLAGSPPNVRPRIVALEIAELVRDVAREPEVLSTAALQREQRPAVGAQAASARQGPAPPSAKKKTPSRIALGAFATASTFRFDGRWLGGGGLLFDYSRDWASAGLDATVAARQERSELGSTLVLLTRISPYVAWRLATGDLAGRLGAGYALGMVRVAGRAEDARAAGGSLTGPWAGPYALFGLAYAATNAVEVDLRAELGVVTLPVVGQVARGKDVSIDGAWTSVQLGLSLAL